MFAKQRKARNFTHEVKLGFVLGTHVYPLTGPVPGLSATLPLSDYGRVARENEPARAADAAREVVERYLPEG